MEDTPQGPQDSAPPPPPPPAETPPQEPAAKEVVSENRTVMIVLSYLWLLALIPLLVEKDDREVQWHAKHGLVLTGAEIALWIGLNVMQWLSGAIFGPLACLGCFAFIALGVAALVVRILCIVKALQGSRFIIPGVSQWADQF